MIKAFLDTNILMDLIDGNRQGSDEAKLILSLVADKYIEAICTTQSLLDCLFISRKMPREKVHTHIKKIASLARVVSISAENLDKALGYDTFDTEDLAQLFCAESSGADILLTNNPKDFLIESPLAILTPGQFISAARQH